MGFTDPLSPPVSIVHPSWQVLQSTSFIDSNNNRTRPRKWDAQNYLGIWDKKRIDDQISW